MTDAIRKAKAAEKEARADFVFWLNHACRELPKGEMDGLAVCLKLLTKFDDCVCAVRLTERAKEGTR